MAGFSSIKPKQMKHGKPPTKGDALQSSVHHVNSVQFNLGHAQAHVQEASKHAKTLADQMKNSAAFNPYVKTLTNAMKGAMP